ncbi:VCBS domain-containing protein [Variovorax humicola]|uniref:VCBS domain-containing protein n=1 Tax=Variovorax humicola TaxID=1769758 RepID=A0ABU8W0I5_9BURK
MNMRHFRPQSHAMALEPRIMFDGAAAAAVEQHHADTPQPVDRTVEHPATSPQPAAQRPAASAPAPAQNLLVIDGRLDQRDFLAAQAVAGTAVLVVNGNEDGLAAISAALARLGQVDSIQILSHGMAGQFELGNRAITSDNVDQLASQLQSWHASLTAGADIQLYGCDVGAGATGRALVSELARWTGADVAASSDETGSAAAGGNWTLETSAGLIDKPIAISAMGLAEFKGLLANASPTVALSSGGSDVLLGGQFSFTASFTNTESQVGFAPYIDVFLPATGKDGDDGATFVSATYLGQAIKTYTVTFDAGGNAEHPLAKDATGAALVIHAADFGMRAGDQLVVLQLPNASVIQGQPSIDIVVTAQLSNLADTNASDPAPDLLVKARGGFQFGNDSADDPTIDPTLVEAGTHDFNIHPTVMSLTQSVPMEDNTTVTGPNYPHTVVVTASAAPGQTVSNVVISQDVPADILVTGITPGAGGVLNSVTLATGEVLTAPAEINAALVGGAYVGSYTVTYAALTGSVDTTLQFYVPETDASGTPVLDPTTGAPVTITVAPPSASAQWTPLDPRDVSSGTIDVAGTGGSASFTAQAIALYKSVAVTTNVGSPQVSPGDTLTYTLRIAMSDYFAFGENLLTQGQFDATDQLSDGQTAIVGSGVLSYTVAGVTKSIPLVSGSVPLPDGVTALSLDIGQSLRNAGETIGALPGDLAFDPVRDGATTILVTYRATVDQDFTTPHPHVPINEGDTVGNDAAITATLLHNPVNLTGGVVTDGDRTTTEIPPSNVDIQVLAVNGAPAPAAVELHPGDVVTFQMSYDLVTGDYEHFILTSFLPLPLFDLSSVNWSEGTGPGQWQIGPGNTTTDTLASVTNGPGNSVIFDYGDNTNPGVAGSRIEVRFTLVVGNEPFGDQRSVTVQAQSDQLTTVDEDHLTSLDAAVISSVAEPVLGMTHGVVSSTGGSISGTIGAWAAPGSAGVPFTGSVTDTKAVDGNIDGFDAGDTLRMATAIENTGGGVAFDVATSVTLPTGLSFVGGSLANTIKVYRGDGTLMVLGTDYSVTGNVVTFLDPGGFASLPAGRAGTAADTSGANLIVITYDVLAAAALPAGSTLSSTATLLDYAGVDGGTDFTPSDPTDTASEQVAVPTISVVFAGGTVDDTDSSSASTTGADVVVGESMLYDIVVTLPEGTAQNLRVDDLVPAGMSLDPTFNGIGYQLITTAIAANGGADYNGTATVGALSGVGGTLGADGVDARLSFTANATAADNVAGNNSFVIRVRLVASNSIDNQAGRAMAQDARLTYTDPDADTPNGAAPIDRVVPRTGAQPVVTLREPTLTITQTNSAVPPLGVDSGDTVDYTITISNGNAATDFAAFDVAFRDVLPTAQLSNLTILSVTLANGATGNPSDFVIDPDGTLHTVSGANIDLPKGGSVTLVVRGTVTSQAANTPSIVNTATVSWTSLDGANAGERNGVDGLLASGVLNDYQASASTDVRVLHGVQLSRIGGLPDTLPPAGGTLAPDEQVAVGEVIRYRVVSAIPEGSTNDLTVTVTLQNGLEYIDDGTVRIAFVSNGGIGSSFGDLATGGTLQVVGDETSGLRQPIATDLSGAAPTSVFNPGHITVSADGNGNTVLTFHLGNLQNNDNDPNFEFATIEFNGRVLNVSANVAGTRLSATPSNAAAGVPISTQAAVLFEDIVEPDFNGVVKQVDSFTPNATATTSHADVSVRFTQDGTAPAFDVTLVDSFAGATAYTPTSVSIGGVLYTPATLPAGVTFTATGGGVTLTFARLDPGVAVVVLYGVDVSTNAAYANSDATLTWSSLPETFTNWGGSTVGTDGTGEGERIGTGTSPNTYLRAEGAGLGLITGALWDDSASPTTSTTPDGTRLAGQTVTLTWAGADGNLATTADNQTFQTVTDANGVFNFSALAAGQYRIDAPTPVTLAQPLGQLRARIDTDASTPPGQVVSNVGEGATGTANVGYVQQNDAPVNTLPGTQNGLEDVLLNLAPIGIADVDAGAGILDVTLTVTKGVLDLSQATTGVTPTGAGTATMTLSGTLADLNVALSRLTYLGALNFNGTDTLTVLAKDRGNFGDADGDGIPGEPVQDQLQDRDTLQIILAPVNDPPQSVPDTALATEAGGVANGAPGVNPIGNMLDNDLDVDIQTNADTLHLVQVRSVATGAVATPPPGAPVDIVGLYGTLTFDLDGGYRYTADNNNPLVQALRVSGQTLTESFEYTMADKAGAADTAAVTPTLTVTIRGANDAPVAGDDAGTAIEAGGVNNAIAGSVAAGNVLGNDTDVDSVANGETKVVTAVRAVPEDVRGDALSVPPGAPPSIAGLYGTLTLSANGDYTYTPDDTNALVQGLQVGQTLNEIFSYQVTDAGGLSDLANLRIVIQGRNDAPVAVDDAANAVEAGGVANATAGTDPTGNVLSNDTDVDTADTKTVTEFRTGNETGTGVNGLFGTELRGTYGWLTLSADGTYSYRVDNNQAEVQALRQGTDTLTDNFSYTVGDIAGGTDRATLAVTIHGANDTPVAVDDTADAVEAGGIANGLAGTNPSGNVITANDSDVDANGEVLSIAGYTFGATAGTLGTPLTATYGSLLLDADGSYTYTVDNANAAVQALRQPTDTLTEAFTYTLRDALGATTTATLTVTIHGADDNPVAADDAATAVEAGGPNNALPGIDPTGNVLTNDTDVDGGAAGPINNGETRAVSTVRAGTEAGTGAAGLLGAELRGTYGWLTLNANGSYSYRLDNNQAEVQALRTNGNTLTDNFSYEVVDAAGATDRATLAITIQGANDTPGAVDDAATAIEAGGVANAIPGVNPTGNVLANDADVDTNGETLSVAGFAQGAVNGTLGTAFTGAYGSLLLNADGTYAYSVDNNNAAVQALRQDSDTLAEVFTYTMRDALGATSTATLTVTIHGRDDNPTAVDDTALAVEAGGVANGLPGVAPTGNVLPNDTDVDDVVADFVVAGIRTGTEAGSGTAGNVGTALAGLYGSLAINADGSYAYTVDNGKAEVQAVRQSGDTLTDVFTYTMADAAVGGATDLAQLTITIQGADDAPVAANDVADAVEAGGVANDIPGVDPAGNVIANDSDVDQHGEALGIAGFTHALGTGTLGTAFTAAYGSLLLDADGTYTYTVDNDNADVQALRVDTDTLTEVFTYTLRDALGATATATLTVTIHGRDDAPVARVNLVTAQEAGGAFNGTPGVNPSGNVLINDNDVDAGDQRFLTGIHPGTKEERLAFTIVTAAPVVVDGQFGGITVDPRGTFLYVVNNTAAAVERLRAGDILSETFTYQTRDDLGLFDVAQITVDIVGAWDAPVGVNDLDSARTGTVRNPGLGVDAVGNVLANDTDVDSPDSSAVSAVGVGAEGTGAVMQPVVPGTPRVIDGLYGRLTINEDGSYVYKVDLLNLQVLALGPDQVLNEFFTYELVDNGGLTDLAQLQIVVRGRNNAPLSRPDTGAAVEAGGLDNNVPGVIPGGNVLGNDLDIDGDPMMITGISAGTSAASGAGTVGQTLRGQWGDLVINADGKWTYTVDNAMAEVQALRVSGQTLVDVFTYTVSDPLGDINTARLSITVDGRNDTPKATDDNTIAVEAGGVNNATSGINPAGNVLANDTDVDSVANGETKQVDGFMNSVGASAVAGQSLAGLYGSLVLDADGSYSYAVDNDNPTVQALRTGLETLTEVFTYTMRDAAGAQSQARLAIVVQGADDNPVALNDSNAATDQTPSPQAAGNVLANDADVDAGDALHVAGIRSGAETGTGAAGVVGQPIAGRYGALVIHADGSYTYSIDLGNPDVLAQAGAGKVLQDVFTYTVADRAGGTDQAELVIDLDIAAPFIEAGASPHPGGYLRVRDPILTMNVEPAIFIAPVVEADSLLNRLSRLSTDGTEAGMVFDLGIQSDTLRDLLGEGGDGRGDGRGDRVGGVRGQFVHAAVRESVLASQIDLARLIGRHGRVSLTADGLLGDPSLFSDTDDHLIIGPAQRIGANDTNDTNDTKEAQDNGNASSTQGPAAAAFTEQLRLASKRFNPSWFR